jgi:hypothetical protein
MHASMQHKIAEHSHPGAAGPENGHRPSPKHREHTGSNTIVGAEYGPDTNQ